MKKDALQRKLDKKAQYERKIIGTILVRFEFIPDITCKLAEENFSCDNRKAFSIIKNLYDEGKISPHLINQLFEENGLNTFPYMQSASATDSVTLDHQMKGLLDLYFSIQEYELLEEYSAINEKADTGLDNLIQLGEEIDSIIIQANRFKAEDSMPDSIDSLFNSLLNTDKSRAIYSRSIPSMNEASFLPGNLVVIAGYLKSGKTSITISLLVDYAVNSGIPVGLFSLEMSKEEVYSKIISNVCNIPYSSLRDGSGLNEANMEVYRKCAKEKIGNAVIMVDDKSQILDAICQKIKFWKHKYNIRIVAVDYLQLVSHQGRKFESTEREIANVSKTLKSLAKELDIVIIGVAQLNREGAINPSSYTIGGSLNICKDADYYYVIYSPVRVEAARRESPVKADDKVSLTMNGKSISIGKDHFVLNLSESRHTAAGKKILLKMENGSKMYEVIP